MKINDSNQSIHSLILRNLTFSFGNKTILDSFSAAIHKGEKIVIRGRSGSGKSTLLRSIPGFIKPDSGAIEINGQMLNGSSVWHLRRYISYVAQEPELGEGTVLEALERSFAYKANKELDNNLNNLESLLEIFLLPVDIKYEYLDSLSGGEKQKIALISAFLLERPLVLLDEPYSALDTDSIKAVDRYIGTLSNTTFISVFHGRLGLKSTTREIDFKNLRRTKND